MTISEAAVAAIHHFSVSDAPTMVAIAGGESAWNPRAAGDDISIFTPTLQQRYAPYAVEGKLSHGLWQIFLPVHANMVRTLSGKAEPKELAEWLYNPENCAQAAQLILDSQGLTAWSVYNNGSYREYENEANAAVTVARKVTQPLDMRQIVAISIAPPLVHIDLADGSYILTELGEIDAYGPWIRFNFTPVEAMQPTFPTA